jgi:hypothetical protein
MMTEEEWLKHWASKAPAIPDERLRELLNKIKCEE